MHPELKSFSAEIPIHDEEKMKKFNEAMDALHEATTKHIEIEAEKLGINYNDMSSIYYLRTRSRWTQEKEDYLIKLSKEGKPLPNVLAGEF